MVVNGMAVTKMAIKWKLVLELPHHIYFIFLPSSHSLLACIIRQKATTSRNHSYHIIRLLLPPLIVDNIINCYLYGICIPHLHLPKMILHIFTWYHGRPVYSLLYYGTGKNTPSSSTESTLSRHRNQNQELHTYQWKNSYSS